MDSTQLKKDLKTRHLTMISLGGVIGAGLFVGSGAVIHETGPAAFLSYLLAGLLVVLVMRMLGEMAAAYPAVGSFSQYARVALGGWAGFSIGWLYWYFWVIVVAVEATAGAGILRFWFPQIPLWVMSLLLMILLTLTNIASVRSYGEFEFWFSSIKVAAIVVFLVLGVLFLLGFWPGSSAFNFTNLFAHGGFAPNGWGAIFRGIVIVIFSFMGSEIVTIAAGESSEPERAVAKATNSVIWRVLIFYVGSIFLVVTILPWNDAAVLKSPYVSALEVMHIPAAADIMNVIVLTAVLSCLNSGLYTASRMLYVLAQRGEAPQYFLALNRHQVPMRAILCGTVIGYLSVIMAYVSPDRVFLFLVNSSGAVALFIYLLIAFSELRIRARLEKESPERLRVKMWLYPYLTYATILGMLAVIISMAFMKDQRSQLLLSLLSFAVVLIAYGCLVWWKGDSSAQEVES